MTLPFNIAPLAQADILDHAFYLSDQSTEASIRFFTNVSLSVQRLSEMPELGSIFEHTDVYNIRIWPVKGFRNYLSSTALSRIAFRYSAFCTVRPITKRSSKSEW